MRYLVLGAGRMGQVACFDLLRQFGTTRVVATDNNAANLEGLRQRFGDDRLKTVEFDATAARHIRQLMEPADACLGAVHYGFNVAFTKAAIETRTHFCDLGGNNSVVAEQLALDEEARAAEVSIIPDCGLAPGMVAVLVAWGVQRWDWVDTVKIRVGGLPQQPQPPLNYSLLFSVEGLINEYVEPVRRLRAGIIETCEPLTAFESLKFPEPIGTVEAFYTSGGVSTLPETYQTRLRDLDYKTIRYPGHGAIMAAMRHLGLFSAEPVGAPNGEVIPRQLTARLLEHSLPHDEPDITLVRIVFLGKDSRKELTIIDRHDTANDISSMARMTAFPAAIICRMLADGRITQRGVFGQERGVPAQTFIDELSRRGIVIDGLPA